ncbi:MAG: hypothetical protein WD749_06895 [Phycisphaerales bacterium]
MFETVTGQGGSGRRPRGAADSRHPSQHGGLTAANLEDTPEKAKLAERERTARVKSGGPAKGPSRKRFGAIGAGGRTRTGRDRSGRRGRARGNSRARGRSPGR